MTLKKLNDVEMLKGNVFKTITCDTCAISKMHQLVNKTSSSRVIISYQTLHFDLIICGKNFDDISCIAHFTDELTRSN